MCRCFCQMSLLTQSSLSPRVPGVLSRMFYRTQPVARCAEFCMCFFSSLSAPSCWRLQRARDPALFTLQPRPTTGLVQRQEVFSGRWSTEAVAGRLSGDVPRVHTSAVFLVLSLYWGKGKNL